MVKVIVLLPRRSDMSREDFERCAGWRMRCDARWTRDAGASSVRKPRALLH